MSRRSAPLTIHVPHSRLAQGRPVAWHVLSPCRRREDVARLNGSFRFRNDEERFARELVERKSNLWIFRSNQRGFCGDFVVVDMSSPAPDQRRVYVIDLKQRARLKLGGGGVGNQFINAAVAVRELAERTGVVPVDAIFYLLSGDREAVLDWLLAATRRDRIGRRWALPIAV
jgi:hypothetical protein